MFSNRFAFGALAIACIAAAGTGGYLATRQSVLPMANPVAAATTATPAPAPVQETEAVVGDVKPASTVAKPDAPSVSPARLASASKPSSRDAKASPSARSAAPPAKLEKTWPSTASAPTPTLPSTPIETSVPAPRVEERPAVETRRTPDPPEKTFEELVVSANSVIGLQTETPVTSEHARVEDPVEARVVRDIRAGAQVAIPAGTRALGSVTLVERGGKVKERARLGIRFHTLVLADGSRMPISTETIYRDGDAPANASAAKIGGGAVAGAILGAILGGGKGAAIGATTGAGAGTAAVMAGDRSAATFPVGTEVTARITSPVTITVEK